MNRLKQELGEGYQQVLLNYLAKEHVVNHGYAPTWWITCDKNTNWKGKSYWVRKALNQLQKDGEVESFRARGNVGWCWALTGKLKKDGY